MSSTDFNFEIEANEKIENAIDWLLRMQVMSGNLKGGFLSGLSFSWLSYRKPFIYSEITGYGLKMLLNLLDEGGSDLVPRIKATADFLFKVQSNDGAFARGIVRKTNMLIDSYYTFDTAICTSALLDLYEVEPNDKFLESSKKAGSWLLKEAQNENGSFKSIYRRGTFLKESRWYGDNCCLHGKNIICLLKLWSHTDEQEFKSSSDMTADWVSSLQLPSGAFKVNANENYIFTHAHCYATEGLLYAYYITRNKDYLSSAINAANWLANMQEEDGGLFNVYGNISFIKRLKNDLFPIRMKTTDAVAQSIRIWVMLYSLTKDATFLQSACNAADFLLRAQFNKEKSNMAGGFYQQQNGPLRLPIMRTWSCIFTIQALSLLVNLGQNFDEIIRKIM